MNTFNKRKLSEILNTGSKITVPEYQRSFVWGKDEANNLINDIKNSDGGSFLGTVVFHKEAESSMTVVDGQQRLTSIFILFSTLRRKALDLGNTKLASSIQSKISYLNDTTGDSDGSRIKVSPKIEYVFNNTVVKYDWSGDFNIEPLKNKKRDVKKIKPIYDEFWLYISTLSQDELTVFLKKTYECYFGEIVIFDITDAFEIFERMNSRGVELNAAELLKNHLFSELLETESDLENKWSVISDNSSGLLRMLKYYYVSRKGHVSYKKLFSKLKVYSQEKGALTILNDLEEFSIIYSLLIDPTTESIKEVFIDRYEVDSLKNDHKIESILRVFTAMKLFGLTQVHPLIMSLINSYLMESNLEPKETDKLISTLQNLEKFIFINHEIVGNPGNKIEVDFSNLAHKVYTEGNFREDCDLINKYLTKKIEDKDKFDLAFTSISYENSSLKTLYYIFDRITNYKQKGTEIINLYNVDQRITRGSYNIEHLAPQSNKDEGNEDIIDNIGNLIAISLHTNSRLHNFSFTKKMSILRERQNRLNIVNNFIIDHGNKDDWTEEDVKQRAKELSDKSYNNIWKLS